jgi:hypothetical protein
MSAGPQRLLLYRFIDPPEERLQSRVTVDFAAVPGVSAQPYITRSRFSPFVASSSSSLIIGLIGRSMPFREFLEETIKVLVREVSRCKIIDR